MLKIEEFLPTHNWETIYTRKIPSRKEELFPINDLSLSPQSKRYLSALYPDGIYGHQKEAIEKFKNQENLCISTGASSGKSLVFYVGAIEKLNQSPDSRIIAIYPLKALAREQKERWMEALKKAGISAVVDQIDGDVDTRLRSNIVRSSKILILTPDIIHSWFLSNLNNNAVLNFLKRLSLVVVDEIHNYTGVFGSNAAFLYRRLQHILKILKASPQYISASATIREPETHLKNLFGIDFSIIGPNFDTSPRYKLEIKLINPPRSRDFLSEVSNFLYYLSANTDTKFLAFVDSRKQSEQIASITARLEDKGKEKDSENGLEFNHLRQLNVLPYRSGYEEKDRTVIQDRLREGSLKGVVSTSALEMGIDIPFLNVGVLIGVPQSLTNFYQRIGRIGRRSEGKIFVLNSGDVLDESIFNNPKNFLNQPLAEGALYLKNTRIQYINALCLARRGGEHDQVCSMLGIDNETIDIPKLVDWPEGFIELCKQERVGEIPVDLQNIKIDAGEEPNHIFPLRDVESQFKVELKSNREVQPRGFLSYSQLMREAYPGAIYYYTTIPLRVFKVDTRSKIVQVKKTKRYSTKPSRPLTLIYPNLTTGNVYKSFKYNKLTIIESNLQVYESVFGLQEFRGPKKTNYNYPLNGNLDGIYFNSNRFFRYYFTTGIIITHPSFSSQDINYEVLAELLYESFLMIIPFERRDINYAMDKFRVPRGPITEKNNFIALYDQTYGSLRLSGRILEEDILKKTFCKMMEICRNKDMNLNIKIDTKLILIIETLYKDLLEKPLKIPFDLPPRKVEEEKFEKIIMPGSKGIDIINNNEEFEVESIFFHPAKGLCYRGKHFSLKIAPNTPIPIEQIKEVPDQSKIGFYNYETGDIKSLD